MRSKWLLSIGLCFLSACGWHLRGVGEASNGQFLSALTLVSASRFSQMTLAVADALQKYGIAEQSNADWQLVLQEERLEKRTVAVNSIGSASQYELALQIDFLYRNTLNTEHLPELRSVTTQRVFDFGLNNTVAKAEEENQLIEEMRDELARRIVRSSSGVHGSGVLNGQN